MVAPWLVTVKFWLKAELPELTCRVPPSKTGFTELPRLDELNFPPPVMSEATEVVVAPASVNETEAGPEMVKS